MAGKILNVGADQRNWSKFAARPSCARCQVVSAPNLLEVIKACEQYDIDLAVLGHVLNVNEKSRITSTVRSIINLIFGAWPITKQAYCSR